MPSLASEVGEYSVVRCIVRSKPRNTTYYKYLGHGWKSQRGQRMCGAQRKIYPSHSAVHIMAKQPWPWLADLVRGQGIRKRVTQQYGSEEGHFHHIRGPS